MPAYGLVENHQVSHHLVLGPFDRTPGNYKWEASGKVKLIPYTYGLTGSIASGAGISITWGEDRTRDPVVVDDQEGSWNVEHKTINGSGLRCGGCKEMVKTVNAHKMPCPNPLDSSEFYFCLYAEQWAHAYEDTCTDLECGATNFYRCTHEFVEPEPPDYPENNNDGPPNVDQRNLIGADPSTPVIVDNSPDCDSCTTGGCSACPITYACGFHSGAPSASSGHVQITPPCGDSSHASIVLYACQTGSTHATQISGNSGSFYECQPHTTGGCGHTYLFSTSYNHRSVPCPTNSNGDSCTLGSSYFCSPHTHVYPAPPTISCGRPACTQTVGSANEHRETCAAGHTWWSCYTLHYNWNYNHHRTRTCRFGTCAQSWQRCTRPEDARTPMCSAASRQGERCWSVE